MKYVFLIFLLLSLSGIQRVSAQHTLKGSVADTFNHEELEYASVAVLRASDSVLLGFTRAGTGGQFSLHIADPGPYLMLVTYPGFADHFERVKPGDAAELQLGKIVMFTRERVLSEFVVHQQRGAIMIKGDTTEYMADSFKVDANANVEALLKKLPGLQVDKDGNVTAHGEKVQKILVDGEEFFSDDPAVVNKNLQAKTVEKVQVFDKKSETAEFTGIDDGQHTKTINLQLKDQYKKGYFGKLALGGGTDQYFENQGMFNLFRGKQKFSVFGIMANTGKITLSGSDNSKFGGGNNMIVDEESGYNYMAGSDGENTDWNGNYNGQGLPKAWSAGAHFSDKWNKDKQHFSSNYRFYRQNVEGVNNTLTQYNLPDSTYYTDQRGTSFSTSDRHKLDGLYEWTIDSLSSLKLTANGSHGLSTTRSNLLSSTKTSGDAMLNNSSRISANEGTNDVFNAALIWKKKFRKKGRTMILEADLNNSRKNNSGILRADNDFYSSGIKDSTTVTDQRKKTDAEVLSLAANITYTEPIAKKVFLELKYRYSLLNNFSRQYSYNKDAGDNYSVLDSTFSSSYDYGISINRAGAALRFTYDKLNFDFGGAASHTLFTQSDRLRDTSYNRNFTNFFPAAHIRYKFNQQSELSLSYNGQTQQPTIDQIQPIRQNTDPLNISIGNPGLKQKFQNSFNFRYNSYKVLTSTYYYAGGGGSFTANDISRTEQINTAGARTFQYINVNGNYSSWLYAGSGYKIRKLDLNTGLNINANQSHVISFVNGLKNISDNNSYTLSGNVYYDKEKKISVGFDPGITYNDFRSSINTSNTSFWSYNISFNVTYHLPYKFLINSEVDWNVRQRTAAFDRNNNVFLWNAYVSRKFRKNESMELRMSVSDILNQNLGFSRYANANTITQQGYNTIRRYGLLSFIWNFTQSHASAAPAAGGDVIEIK